MQGKLDRIADALRPLAVPIDSVRPHERNPRHGDIGALSQSLDRFGQTKPIIVQASTGRILGGNHTWKAAKALGWAEIAVHSMDVDDGAADAILIADNRIGDLGTYDDTLLAGILSGLADADALAGTGYDGDDVDALLATVAAQQPKLTEPDAVPDPPAVPITQPGDIIRLGKHRLVCGDSRDFVTVDRLFAGAVANVVVTSPPYASQRAYDESSGFRPIPPAEYGEWFRDVAANIMAHLAEDGSYFLNIKEHADEGQRVLYIKDLTLAHVRAWGWRLVDEFCWLRPALPMYQPNRFKNGWEPVFHFARNPAIKMRHDNVKHETEAAFSGGGIMAVTSGGTYFPGVHTAPGLALPSNVIKTDASHRASPEERGHHTASYPVALPTFFIRAFSDVGDAVFDPFGGSGTTLIAAEQEMRIAYVSEISPAYCDVIVRRWEEFTGRKAQRVTADGEVIDGA